MRFIARSKVLEQIDPIWFNTARLGSTLMRRTPYAKRRKTFDEFLKQHTTAWAALKLAFSNVVGTKCWFTERELPLGELVLDHFRPKLRIAGLRGTPHKGYWWLSFQWMNLRLSCSLANVRRTDPKTLIVGGKGSYFPLLSKSRRVGDHSPQSIKSEKVVLLDPFIVEDTALLGYSTEGLVKSRYSKQDRPVAYFRVEQSINFYHLNESTLIKQRTIAAANIRFYSDVIERLIPTVLNNIPLSEDDQNLWDNAFAFMHNCVQPNAQYSEFCKACVEQLGDLGWNTELLSELEGVS